MYVLTIILGLVTLVNIYMSVSAYYSTEKRIDGKTVIFGVLALCIGILTIVSILRPLPIGSNVSETGTPFDNAGGSTNPIIVPFTTQPTGVSFESQLSNFNPQTDRLEVVTQVFYLENGHVLSDSVSRNNVIPTQDSEGVYKYRIEIDIYSQRVFLGYSVSTRIFRNGQEVENSRSQTMTFTETIFDSQNR